MTSFGRVCANISEEEGEQTSWNGCEKLVWVRVGSLGVVGFVPDEVWKVNKKGAIITAYRKNQCTSGNESTNKNPMHIRKTINTIKE